MGFAFSRRSGSVTRRSVTTAAVSGLVPVGVALAFGVPARADKQQTGSQNTPPLTVPQSATNADKTQAAVPQPAPGAASLASEPLTLARAINLALQYQPQITQAVENERASRERVTQAQSSYYPAVSPQYTYLSQFNYGPVSRFTATNGGNSGVIVTDQGTSSTTRAAELGASYRLFDTGARNLNARAARQEARGQAYATQNTRQTVIGNVADAYFAALRTAALVKVAEAQVANTNTTLQVVQAQVQAGTAAQKDIFQAQADYANAQVSLLQARNNAAISQAQLKNTMGIVGGDPLPLADVPPPTADTPLTAVLIAAKPSSGNVPAPSATTPPVPAPTTTPTDGAMASSALDGVPDAEAINQFAQTAYQARPDLAQSKQNVEANQTSVSLAKVNSRVLVTSDVTAGLQLDPVHFNKQKSNSRQVNLLLSYPLFDGGFARSQVRGAQASERASEAGLQSLQQQIAVEVEQAYRNLNQARATLPASKAALTAAQKNYEAASAARQEGVGSLVEVITAQTTLVQAQINYVQAVYDFYAADARLAAAVGQADRIAVRAENTPPAAPGTNAPTAGSKTGTAVLRP